MFDDRGVQPGDVQRLWFKRKANFNAAWIQRPRANQTSQSNGRTEEWADEPNRLKIAANRWRQRETREPA